MRVKSSLLKFHHDFFEADGRPAGSLDTSLWPTRPRLDDAPATVCSALVFRGRSARIEFDWLTSGRDLASSRPIFFLMEGARQIAHATLSHATRRSWRIKTKKFSGVLERNNRLSHGIFSLTPDNGASVEAVRVTTPFLSFKRSYELAETPAPDELLAPFLFFIACNSRIAS